MRAPVLRIAFVALVLGCPRYEEMEPPWTKDDEPIPPMSNGQMPAPVSGGTLALTSDGRIWVASDPNADTVWIAEPSGGGVSAVPVPFETGAQPGRVAIEDDQRAHVVLRGAGAVATIGLGMKQLEGRVSVCPEPRGIAWDGVAGKVRVACADGQLVSFMPESPATLERWPLDSDLRDVVVTPFGLWVSRFRSAELLRVRDGMILSRLSLPNIVVFSKTAPTTYAPAVAWRLITLESGELAVVHQGARIDPPIDLGTMASTSNIDGGTPAPSSADGGLEASASPYGSSSTSAVSCSAAVRSFVTTIDVSSGSRRTTALQGVLPVDVTDGPGTGELVVASAGEPNADVVIQNPASNTTTVECVTAEKPFASDAFLPAVAVAYSRAASTLVVQEESFDGHMAQLTATVGGTIRRLSLTAPRASDMGRAVFHVATRGNSLACASCHPEATEDGRVWNFQPIGARRTQALRGGIIGRAPYHWDGDLPTFESLMTEVFSRRMGASFSAVEAGQVANWLESVPGLKTGGADEAAAQRGRIHFTSAATGCASCHSGSLFTSGAMADVGTGGTFKVPSLVGLGLRAPYMHNGCATTLQERFTAFGTCGGGDLHGSTSQLTASELSDLIAYLKTL